MATTALPNPTLDVYSLAPLLIINNDGAELVDGRFEGEGSVTFSTGNTYVGPFRNGYMEGNGTYTWAATGTTFQGDLKKNKIVGSGTYTWKSGCKYEGQVSDGLRHGKGTFSCAPLSSAWYEGSWNAGKMCGQGKLTYTDNASYNYEGTWREGLKNGRGIMRYASGNVYDGEWLNNVKHGHGVMQWLDRGETYEGAWQNGKPNGYGLYTWSMRPAKSHQFPTQNRYKGNWENGKRNGQGTFEYANGAVYTGDWKDDMKHGFGKYISENGRRYVGEWKNDRPVGGLEPYRNECPYTFHLADLLPGSDANSLETELQQVNDIVMRHIQDLRAIYSFYADNGLSRRSHKGSPMTLVDLCRLIKDCGVLDRKVTLADCTRIYARQFKDDDCHVEQYQAPHDPAQTFILHDFLHFLLRVSHLLYAHTPNLSLHSTGLAASFSHFIKHDLLPNITFHTPTDDITTFQAELRCFFEDRYADTLYAMYDERARFRPGKSLPGSRGDRTWTFRDVTLVVGEYGLLTNRDSLLTMTTVVEVLSGGGKRIVEDGCYNLEHEMLSTEWFDGTYDAILLVHHSYFTTHVLPTVFGIDPPHHPNPLQPHDQHNHNHNQKNPNHSSTDSFLSEVKSFSRHLLTDDTDQPSPPAETTEKHAEKRGKDKENGNGVGNRPGSSGRGHGKEEKDARVHKEESGHRSPLLGHEGPAAVAAGKESRMSTSNAKRNPAAGGRRHSNVRPTEKDRDRQEKEKEKEKAESLETSHASSRAKSKSKSNLRLAHPAPAPAANNISNAPAATTTAAVGATGVGDGGAAAEGEEKEKEDTSKRETPVGSVEALEEERVALTQEQIVTSVIEEYKRRIVSSYEKLVREHTEWRRRASYIKEIQRR